MGIMIFNNISTIDMGVIIQTPPVYEFPSKNYESIQIEGRSGDLLIDKKSFNNTRRTYRLALVFKPNTDFTMNAIKLVEWLTGAKGYVRLEDSYDPDHFRLAMFNNNGELTNILDEVTAINATFDCKPQRYLKLGEVLIEVPNDGAEFTIFNPTPQVALPELIITNANNAELKVNGSEVLINKVGSGQDFYIDSDLEEVYKTTTGEPLNILGSLNNDTTLGGDGKFPSLKPGINTIKLKSGSATKIYIRPRWWRL